MESQINLSWDSHKTIFCNGFNSLQQNGEFVDMTIAADGQFVKVHQMVMALASPYLKELITSVACQHPVIFLNNVSYETLCSLLEYVYTGEVLLPAKSLYAFEEIAKSLQIKGLESLSRSEYISQLEAKEFKNILTFSGEETEQTSMPLTREIDKADSNTPSAYSAPTTTRSNLPNNEMPDYAIVGDSAQDSDDGQTTTVDSQASMLNANTCLGKYSALYTVTNRGAVQLILDRFMYYCHYRRNNGRKRRWRCIDYRDARCPGSIDTDGEQIVDRNPGHNHPNHDQKIRKKMSKDIVKCFATLELAQAHGLSWGEFHETN